MYVACTPGQIIYIAMVSFEDEDLDTYADIIDTTWERYANWEDTMPTLRRGWRHARNAEMVKLALLLRRGLRELVDRCGSALPAAVYLKPSVAALWNFLKIGIDVFTAHMKNIRRHKVWTPNTNLNVHAD